VRETGPRVKGGRLHLWQHWQHLRMAIFRRIAFSASASKRVKAILVPGNTVMPRPRGKRTVKTVFTGTEQVIEHRIEMDEKMRLRFEQKFRLFSNCRRGTTSPAERGGSSDSSARPMSNAISAPRSDSWPATPTNTPTTTFTFSTTGDWSTPCSGIRPRSCARPVVGSSHPARPLFSGSRTRCRGQPKATRCSQTEATRCSRDTSSGCLVNDLVRARSRSGRSPDDPSLTRGVMQFTVAYKERSGFADGALSLAPNLRRDRVSRTCFNSCSSAKP
jgi:hypothetical protein